MPIALYSFREFVFDYETLKMNGLLRNILGGQPFFLVLTAVAVVLGYLLGSLNFALILSRFYFHDDVRAHGSGNAGYTNMRRVYGAKIARLVLAGDFLKNVFAVSLSTLLFGYVVGTLTGCACVLGHCFPCFFSFRGGKGIAALAGMVLVLDPVLFLVLLLIFLLVLFASRYLSLASVMAGLLYPVLLRTVFNYLHMTALPALFLGGTEGVTYEVVPMLNGAVTTITDSSISLHLAMLPGPCLLVSILIAILLLARHWGNLKRILDGKEDRFFFKKKAAAPAVSSDLSLPADRNSAVKRERQDEQDENDA